MSFSRWTVAWLPSWPWIDFNLDILTSDICAFLSAAIAGSLFGCVVAKSALARVADCVFAAEFTDARDVLRGEFTEVCVTANGRMLSYLSMIEIIFGAWFHSAIIIEKVTWVNEKVTWV